MNTIKDVHTYIYTHMRLRNLERRNPFEEMAEKEEHARSENIQQATRDRRTPREKTEGTRRQFNAQTSCASASFKTTKEA